MIANILGAALGSAIDRSDGEGGIAGAAIGAISVSVLKRVIPLALIAGGVFALTRTLGNRSATAE